MGLTNFPNGISSFGIPVMGDIPATFGNVYFVDYRNGSDGNKGLSADKAFKTVSKPNDSTSICKTNENNIILIDGDSTVVETSMLTVTKNRLHFMGLNGVGNPLGYGNGAKIQVAVSAGAANIATMQNTGVRNTFSNIKFVNGSTVDQGLYSVVEAGEYARYFACEIYKSTDLDVTGAAELVSNGDSSLFMGCTIGSLANAIATADLIHPNVLVTKGIVAGKVSRDVAFVGCMFWRKSGHVNNRFVYGANATDVERMMKFQDCEFWNAKLSVAVPAENIDFGAAQTQGEVLVKNCTAMNAATAMATQTGIFVDGPVPAADTTGIALQAT